MADHPNVELIRRGYEAYATGNLDTVNDLFADDIVWHAAGRSPLSGTFEGKEAVFGLFAKIAEISEGTSKIEIHDVLANDEHGVALVSISADRGDEHYEDHDIHVFHIKDGKVVEFWDSPIDQQAADDFWT